MSKSLILNGCFKRLYSITSPANQKINHVTVIGSGLMGSGIAQVTAEAGIKVTLVDQNEAILKKALGSIHKSLQRVAKKKFEKDPPAGEKLVNETMGRIVVSTAVDQGAERADLIIEAIVENMKIKHELFTKLDQIAPKETIFTSNTSSLPIKEIAGPVSRKDKFGGLHFFNPVPIMKLLEVIRTEDTSADTYQTLLDYGKLIGKVTVECKDTPGFIVNRLLVPYLAQAIYMYERGDASCKDIDTAMKLGAGKFICLIF